MYNIYEKNTLGCFVAVHVKNCEVSKGQTGGRACDKVGCAVAGVPLMRQSCQQLSCLFPTTAAALIRALDATAHELIVDKETKAYVSFPVKKQ